MDEIILAMVLQMKMDFETYCEDTARTMGRITMPTRELKEVAEGYDKDVSEKQNFLVEDLDLTQDKDFLETDSSQNQEVTDQEDISQYVAVESDQDSNQEDTRKQYPMEIDQDLDLEASLEHEASTDEACVTSDGHPSVLVPSLMTYPSILVMKKTKAVEVLRPSPIWIAVRASHLQPWPPPPLYLASLVQEESWVTIPAASEAAIVTTPSLVVIASLTISFRGFPHWLLEQDYPKEAKLDIGFINLMNPCGLVANMDIPSHVEHQVMTLSQGRHTSQAVDTPDTSSASTSIHKRSTTMQNITFDRGKTVCKLITIVVENMGEMLLDCHGKIWTGALPRTPQGGTAHLDPPPTHRGVGSTTHLQECVFGNMLHIRDYHQRHASDQEAKGDQGQDSDPEVPRPLKFLDDNQDLSADRVELEYEATTDHATTENNAGLLALLLPHATNQCLMWMKNIKVFYNRLSLVATGRLSE